MNPPTITPSGWYPDPSGAPGMRFWDGNDWTPHFAPPSLGRAWTAGRVLALIGGAVFVLLALGGFGAAVSALKDADATNDGAALVLDLVLPTALALVGVGMVVGALRRRPKLPAG